MADLGALDITLSDDDAYSIGLKRSNPVGFNPKYDRFIDMPANGSRTGLVKVGGVATPGVLVRLYWRDNGALLEEQFTNDTGHYTFTGLDPTTPFNYYVAVMDPATSAPFNYTLVQDHLTATTD